MPALTIAAFTALALQCAPGDSVLTLAAIAHRESGFDPLIILDNTTKQAQRFRDLPTAVQVTSALIAAGHSVDVGLMQINSKNYAALGLTVEAAFDPCRSVQAGATVLRWRYEGGATPAAQQGALVGAISSYNTGSPTRGIENGYVQRVQASAGLLIPDIQLTPGAASSAPAATLAPQAGSALAAASSGPIPVRVLSAPTRPPAWDVYASAAKTGAK